MSGLHELLQINGYAPSLFSLRSEVILGWSRNLLRRLLEDGEWVRGWGFILGPGASVFYFFNLASGKIKRSLESGKSIKSELFPWLRTFGSACGNGPSLERWSPDSFWQPRFWGGSDWSLNILSSVLRGLLHELIESWLPWSATCSIFDHESLLLLLLLISIDFFAAAKLFIIVGIVTRHRRGYDDALGQIALRLEPEVAGAIFNDLRGNEEAFIMLP